MLRFRILFSATTDLPQVYLEFPLIHLFVFCIHVLVRSDLISHSNCLWASCAKFLNGNKRSRMLPWFWEESMACCIVFISLLNLNIFSSIVSTQENPTGLMWYNIVCRSPPKSKQKPQKRHYISEDDDDSNDFQPSPSVRRKLDHSFRNTSATRY